MNCLTFANITFNGDPIIPEPINTSTAEDGSLVVTGERQQAPYPGIGVNYTDRFHNMSNTFPLVVDTIGFSLTLDTNANSSVFPSSYSAVQLPILNRNTLFNNELLSYSNTWTNSQPYDFNNPAKMSNMSQSLHNYYKSAIFVVTNVIGNVKSISVTDNISTFKTTLDNYFITTQPSPSDHETVCTFIKSEVAKIRWNVTETLTSPLG